MKISPATHPGRGLALGHKKQKPVAPPQSKPQPSAPAPTASTSQSNPVALVNNVTVNVQVAAPQQSSYFPRRYLGTYAPVFGYRGFALGGLLLSGLLFDHHC